MLYQTLLGAWPLDGHDETFVERMQAYALKPRAKASKRRAGSIRTPPMKRD